MYEFARAVQGAPGLRCRCVLARSRSFGSTAFTFALDAAGSSHSPVALHAKKVGVMQGAAYLISLDESDLAAKRSMRGAYFLGKLKVKPRHSYVLFDAGVNPGSLVSLEESKDASEPQDGARTEDGDGEADPLHEARTELAVIRYWRASETGSRRMVVATPRVRHDGAGVNAVHVWRPRAGGDKDQKMRHNLDSILETGVAAVDLRRRLQCAVEVACGGAPLGRDFAGRRVSASRKSCRLVEADFDGGSEDTVGVDLSRAPPEDAPELLRMYRIGEDRWGVVHAHPLTMLQAFGICLTRFDARY